MRSWPLVLVTAFAANAQTLVVDGSNSPYTLSAATTFAQVTVTSGSTLIVNAPLTVTGTMSVQAVAEVAVDQSVGTLKLNVMGTLTVDSGGRFTLTRRGSWPGPLQGLARRAPRLTR